MPSRSLHLYFQKYLLTAFKYLNRYGFAEANLRQWLQNGRMGSFNKKTSGKSSGGFEKTGLSYQMTASFSVIPLLVVTSRCPWRYFSACWLASRPASSSSLV